MKNLQVNNEKFNSLRGLALALVLVTPFMLTGCSKKADCAVTVPHAHLYTNEAGYDRYVPKENLRFEGYDRQEEYISIEEGQTIKLLPKGLDIAKTIYERHTVLTEFLEQLGVKTSIASSDACKIEHDISPESFKAIKKLVKKNKEAK